MKRPKSIWMVGVFLIFLASANATLQVSVSTDKSVYQPDETVHIFVSAYNPTSTEVTLDFGTSLQATYLLDGTYWWDKNKVFLMVITHQTIQPYQTFTWPLDHGAREQNYYSLAVGSHSVQGLVFSVLTDYQYSEPATFQIVPEPTTLLLLGLGSLISRKRKS